MADDLLGRPVVAAMDLNDMTPRQVEEVWQASIVTDPSVLPADYVAMIQRRASARLAGREMPAVS